MKSILIILTTLLLSFTAHAEPSNKKIAETDQILSPLLVGQTIPDVMTTTITGEQKPLATFIGNKPTILFFYRGGWCPFCNVQMGQLQAIEKDLSKMGYQLVGISTDSPADLKKSLKDKELSYQLLSDYNSTVSQAFGLAFFASEKVTKRYTSKMNLANPLQKNIKGEDRLVLPAPAVYIIDNEGLVHFQYINPNFKVRLDPELLLHAAKLAL